MAIRSLDLMRKLKCVVEIVGLKIMAIMSQRGVQKLKMCGSQDYERGYTPIYLVLGTF